MQRFYITKDLTPHPSSDANGNLTKKEEYLNNILKKTTTTTFNYDNLLASYSITESGVTTSGSFSYDGDGRQTSATRQGNTTKYLYDGLNILEDLSNAGSIQARYLTELGLDDLITNQYMPAVD